MVFVDYKQAYDSINREELWNTLIYFGIPKKYVNMVKLCNNKTECKVKFLGELSSTFEVKSGLRQGDALSPTLFNLGLEKVIREINHSHLVEVVDKEIILAYADDIVILGNTRQDITQTMSNLVTASKRMGLCINEEKTKFMVLSRRREDQPNLQVDNFTFESVESFKYLGSSNIDPDLNYKIINNNMAHQNVNKTSTSVARKRDNDLFKCISDDSETSKSDFEEYSQQKKKKLTNSFHLNSNDNNIITSDPKQSSTDEMLRSLICSVTNIKYKLKDMTTKMDRIEERRTNIMLYTAINDYPCNSSGNVLHTNSIDESWNFPLTSFEELDGFEQKLLDDGYKIKLVKLKILLITIKKYVFKINLDQLFKKIGKTNNWGNDKGDFGKIIPQ
ncbi:hypothetical protein QTP88_004336 [Uroleucon formosanum]